jgi:predicted DNA-binding transcriptional regulator AlpA
VTLVGVSEIHEQFGIDRMQVSRLMRAGDFPAPLETLSAGRVWDLATVKDAVARLRKERRVTKDGRIIPRRFLEV